jgi:hypothetical protein
MSSWFVAMFVWLLKMSLAISAKLGLLRQHYLVITAAFPIIFKYTIKYKQCFDIWIKDYRILAKKIVKVKGIQIVCGKQELHERVKIIITFRFLIE